MRLFDGETVIRSDVAYHLAKILIDYLPDANMLTKCALAGGKHSIS